MCFKSPVFTEIKYKSADRIIVNAFGNKVKLFKIVSR